VARPFATKVTRWREDPFAMGSYSYMPAVRGMYAGGGWGGLWERSEVSGFCGGGVALICELSAVNGSMSTVPDGDIG
jgi:hypothetical protein